MGYARSELGVIVMTERRFSGKQQKNKGSKEHKSRMAKSLCMYALMVCALLLVTTFSFADAQQNSSTWDLFSFNHITAEQGRKCLADAQVGDISHLPNSPTVLVTSSNAVNLQKARVVKDIVDCTEEYAVKIIPSSSITKGLPSAKQIMDNIGTIAIGNFSNPPASDGHARTIVDTCKDGVIIITPSRLVDRVAETIERLQKAKQQETLKQIPSPQANNISDSGPGTRDSHIRAASYEPRTTNNEQEQYLNQRITDGTEPVKRDSGLVPLAAGSEPEKTKPVQTESNLLAENPVLDISGIPNPDDTIVLNLTDQLTLVEFIGLVGPLLKLDFMYNDDDLAGQNVTISPNGVLKGPVEIRELYYYLEAVLKFKGFVMTKGKRSNLVTIVPRGDALNIDPELATITGESSEVGDSVRVDFFDLKYISTKTAKELIGNMKLGIQITDIPETKTLIVTEYASRMPRIKELLDIVDKPGEPKKFRFRQLQYTMAQTLAPKIQALAEQLGTISITINTTSESPALPEPPVRRDGESPTAFASRQRAYQAQVRQIAAAANVAARTPAPTTSGSEPAAPTVFLDSDERTNRILMIGLKKQLDEVEELIDTLDVAQRDPRRLQIYKIEYLDAEEVLNKLADLKIIPNNQASSSSSGSSRTRTTQSGRLTTGETPVREPVPLTAGASSENETTEALSEEPVVVLISSTNSLLVNATEEQHARIADIINLVDKQREEIPFQVYKLKNADPDHVLEILKPLIEEDITGPDDKIQRVEPKQDERITIVSDPNTSSLVVNANKKNQAWIESLIKELDKRKPQVLIDVTLVQISKTDAFDYDLNMISSFPDLTNTSGLTQAIAPSLSTSATNLFNPQSGRDTRYVDLQSNGGLGTGFFGDRHINALLKLMEQKDYGRVMAKPKILVNDNQVGTISTTDTTYVKKTKSIPVGTGGAGNEATLIETAIDYAPYDAGIVLNITPHISESDLLRLDIELQRSDFIRTATEEKPPDTTDSTVGTTVTVPDGSTIILGGLLKLNQSKGGTKIPILGDLPLIGTLFRSTSNSDEQRNLYVFVKAEIIRPPEEGEPQVDLERISKVNREAFERYENEFQGYQSFPGVKPTPMEPAKVLDAQ
jgi:general secretion pathway protein D